VRHGFGARLHFALVDLRMGFRVAPRPPVLGARLGHAVEVISVAVNFRAAAVVRATGRAAPAAEARSGAALARRCGAKAERRSRRAARRCASARAARRAGTGRTGGCSATADGGGALRKRQTADAGGQNAGDEERSEFSHLNPPSSFRDGHR